MARKLSRFCIMAGR